MKSQIAKLTLTLTLLLLFYGVQSSAQPKTAALIAHSRSIALQPFSGELPPFGAVTNCVTTFDGTTGIPLGETNRNFSYELRPRTGHAGVYEADYMTFDDQGFYQQYGSFTVNLPTVDTDADGMPDFAQKEMSGNASFTGSLVVEWPLVTSTNISGTFKRTAGSLAGTYSVIVPGTVSVTYTGSLHLPRLEGEVMYARGTTNMMALHLTRFGPAGETTTLDGITTFNVAGPGQISMPQFGLTSSDHKMSTVQAITLNRSGKKYVGGLAFVDGELNTSWQDYVNWVLELTDPNDSDTNGIPDLSDTLYPAAPVIWQQPDSQRAYNGMPISLRIVVTGITPFAYQWLRNGNPIAGATDAILPLLAVQSGDAGVYSVIVSNPYGSVTSSNAYVCQSERPDFRWALAAPFNAGNVWEGTAAKDIALGALTGDLFVAGTHGSSGLWVGRYDLGGKLVWSKGGSGSDNLDINSVAVDRSNNVFIVGSFYGGCRLTCDDLTITNGPDLSMVLVRYDAGGRVLWARNTLPGPGQSFGLSFGWDVAADSSAGVYVTGYLQGDHVDFGTTNLSASGKAGFLAKYDLSGQVAWATLVSEQQPPGPKVCADLSGFVYTAGSSRLAKYDSSGHLIWDKVVFTGSGWSAAVAADPSGNSYILGSFTTPLQFGTANLVNHGSNDLFVAKFWPDGGLAWATRFAGNAAHIQDPKSISVDKDGCAYVCGLFRGQADFGSVILTSCNTSAPPYQEKADGFATKIDIEGNFCWAIDIRPQDPMLTTLDIPGVAVIGFDRVAVVGGLTGQASFGSFDLLGNGWPEMFLALAGAPPPALGATKIGLSIHLFWPQTDPEFVLEHTDNIVTTSGWDTEVESPMAIGQVRFQSVPAGPGQRFFRLKSP